MKYILAIDYGTSFTSAATFGDSGRAEVMSIQGYQRYPSHVFLDTKGRLLVGDAAENSVAVAPDRYERSPKRELGFGAFALGDEMVLPEDAAAAVLRVVMGEAARRHGGHAPAEVRLTHPAGWGDARKNALKRAATNAGIASQVLVSEPEAAAHHFAHAAGTSIAPGSLFGVYDLGGGTFDTAVLRCVAPGEFELAGPPGGTAIGNERDAVEIGGELFDRHVYDFLGRQFADRDPPGWATIANGKDRKDRQARRVLLEDARRAKESLSTETSRKVWVDRLGDDLVITRAQFETLIAGDVDASLSIMRQTLTTAGVQSSELAQLFLTGGSSRIPLVEESVKRHFGRADTKDDPKTIVALGAAAMATQAIRPGRPAKPPRPAPPAPTGPPRPTGSPTPAVPPTPTEPLAPAQPPPPADSPTVRDVPVLGQTDTTAVPWFRKTPAVVAAVLVALAVAVGAAAAGGVFGGEEYQPTPPPPPAPAPPPPAPAPPPPSAPVSDFPPEGSTLCDEPDVAVDASTTSCPFAIDVRDAWLDASGNVVDVYSEAAASTITMECDAEQPLTTCTGGDAAVVYIEFDP